MGTGHSTCVWGSWQQLRQSTWALLGEHWVAFNCVGTFPPTHHLGFIALITPNWLPLNNECEFVRRRMQSRVRLLKEHFMRTAWELIWPPVSKHALPSALLFFFPIACSLKRFYILTRESAGFRLVYWLHKNLHIASACRRGVGGLGNQLPAAS